MMKNIYATCKPRQDILAGMFNPEIFTASLSQVVDHYHGKSVVTHALYTDAKQFFTYATYPTEGLKSVALEVMSRLSGDASAPAIHRLETAFGGGKTHTLIALTHLAQRGNEIADTVSGIVPANVLSKAGEIIVVGIAGDELPVIKTQGTKMTPYTLWGEIAYQVGGEGLYTELEAYLRQLEEKYSALNGASPSGNSADWFYLIRKMVENEDPRLPRIEKLVRLNQREPSEIDWVPGQEDEEP